MSTRPTAQQALVHEAREARRRLNEPRAFHPARPVTLHARPAAWATIHRDLLHHSTRHVETGGPLHGQISDTAVIITRAGVWPDETSERTPTRLGYRLGDTAIDDSFLGTWHSHPTTLNASLSPGDLADDVGLLEELPRDRLVSVVTTYTGHAALARGLFDASAWLFTHHPQRGISYEPMAIRR